MLFINCCKKDFLFEFAKFKIKHCNKHKLAIFFIIFQISIDQNRLDNFSKIFVTISLKTINN